MTMLVYVRLIGFTAGTLLHLFWIVVLLGYRRQRNFERVFFLLSLALFFFYAGSLLALNAQIYYLEPPAFLTAFAKTLLCAGLCFLPALLMHVHFEYANTRGLLTSPMLKGVLLLAAYVPALYFALRAYPLLANSPGFDFLVPGEALGRGYGVWLALAMMVGGAWNIRFYLRAPERAQSWFHGLLAGVFAIGAALVTQLHVLGAPLPRDLSEGVSTLLALLALLPSAVLIYMVQRFNFLQIGRQKNLVYAVSAAFLALLYLSLVRRLSGWLAPQLPPEATASILLFVLVIFFEPLQRLLGRRLQETAQKEMDRVQRLLADIQEEARQGNERALARFIEKRLQETFELAALRVGFEQERETGERQRALGKERGLMPPYYGKPKFVFSEGKVSDSFLTGDDIAGFVRAEPYGSALSGETRAALEFLCEQLLGALDLCRMIGEKVRLERELAERERLALLGQMAASISHNLKNPLGSIKTILQVQMENPELPDSLRSETQIVLDEVGRLSSKLNQLLQFSRPAIRGGSVEGSCDAAAVIEEVAGVLRHEAEGRGIALELQLCTNGALVAAAADAVSDIVSNLVVNALEATPRGGRVSIAATANHGVCVLAIEDSGPGIAPEAREKLLQPFFTTKTQGTGLGLAIVSRRVAEFSGEIRWASPVREGGGVRFEVALPMQPKIGKAMDQGE
ncbi:MAG TPA: ATP-binding protein [Candidatus Acidoferrum sp.]|nr:ATP-binding protein [Candidatus Acidoferrum sp.]